MVPGLGFSLLKPFVEGDTVLSAPLGSLAKNAVSDISLLDPFPESGSVCPNRKKKNLVFYRKLNIIIAPKATGSRITLHEV